MHLQPGTDCPQLPLPGFALPLSQLGEGCLRSGVLVYLPERWLPHSAVWEDGRTCADEVHAGNGSAGQGNQGADVALFCFLSLVCPMASLRPFSLLVLNIYLYSSCLCLLFLPAVTCGGLLGTQSFWGKCKLQAAPSPSVFSSESSVSESWTGDRVLWRRAEFRSIPGSQALAVQKWDFLKRGHSARAGRRRALAEADAPAFLSLKESCSNQTSASRPTDNPQLWRETNNTQSPLVRCINGRGSP